MTLLFSNRAVLAIVVILLSDAAVWGQGSTSYSVTQTDFDDNVSVNETFGPSPNPVVSVSDLGTPSSTYFLDASYELDALTLRTMASMTVSGLVGEGVNWKSIQAHVSASSLLRQPAIVQGVPNGSSGTVEFNFTISGNTIFGLSDLDNVDVTQFLSTNVLRVPLAGGIVFSDSHSLPSGTTSFDDSFPVVGTVGTYGVPFSAGTELLVDFEMFSRVDLSLDVLNAALGGGTFEANLAALYGQSAVLNGVSILDPLGARFPSATLVATDGSNRVYPTMPVPEPGSFLLVFTTLSVVLSVTLLHRRIGRGVSSPPDACSSTHD